MLRAVGGTQLVNRRFSRITFRETEMTNSDPFRPSVTYSQTTWIIGVIVVLVVVFAVGYYALYQTAPTLTQGANPSAGGSPTPSTLPTPAPSTPAATPK